MKRDRFPLFFLLFFFFGATAAAEESPLEWLNDARAAGGKAPVAADDLLCAAATRWAELCAAAGILSHQGRDGSTALERYRAVGGTEVRVGEILGAGPVLDDIERAWLASQEHRRVVLETGWTHVGWGRAATHGNEVWVVQFTEKRVADLAIEETGDASRITGRLLPATATGIVLLDGSIRLQPSRWDAATREFLFLVSPSRGYFRLEYAVPGQELTLTNAFTLPRGKGSPEGQGHSSAPGASP